jgi:hypothetical protein
MEAPGAEEEKAGEPSSTTTTTAATARDGASSDDSVQTSSSISSILKFGMPRQRSDGGESSSAEEAPSPDAERRGGRRRRRLAFGRVTTHPFDTREPSSLRFDHEATVSEASADRWESFLRPRSTFAARRRRGRGEAAAATTNPAGSPRPLPHSLRIDVDEATTRNSRWAAEAMPQSPRRRSSVNALLGILDEVSLLTIASSSPEADASQSQMSYGNNNDEALVSGPRLTPSSSEDGRIAVVRRPRGIEPLPADLLHAAWSLDEEDRYSSLRSDQPIPGEAPEERSRPAPSRGGGDKPQPRRPLRKERAKSLWHGSAAAPRDKVSRIAPPRQVGRRGSTLHAFLRDPLHHRSNAAEEQGKVSPLRSQQRRGEPPLIGPTSGEDPCTSGCQGRTSSLLVPIDDGKVRESSRSTQDSDSEGDADEIIAGLPTEAPPRFHFASPLLRRKLGVKSSERPAGINLSPSNDDEPGGGRPNRSSMVTNLPSRTFSLAPANPCYRSKDGLQSTHRAPGKSSSFRRWTLVSILPSRKSRSSPSLFSQ